MQLAHIHAQPPSCNVQPIGIDVGSINVGIKKAMPYQGARLE
jgi:hypothetical protein